MKQNYHSKDYLIAQLKTKNYLQIAKENNVDSSTIQRWLKKYSLTKKYDYWNSEELELLKGNYLSNQELHKLFSHRSLSSVYHKGNKLRLKREMRQRDYSVNENFFKKWSPEMAYVFGWFCSDGHVSKEGDYCSLHIHVNDKLILRKIKLIMDSNHPIPNYAESSQFRIYNKVLCADLIQLGCIPKKSVILPFPNVPEEYLSHFARGFFDGDGSIHFNKPNTIKVCFFAGYSFLEVFKERLKKEVNIETNSMRKHHNIWILTYFGDNARKLCFWMYKNCGDMYLDRKKERFNNHLIKRKVNGI